MRRSRKILLAILIVLIIIQFIQPSRNDRAEVSATDITKNHCIPENVQRVLQNACYDCHSNKTLYPWYSRIQPFSWLLANHIKKGKAELNFNEFGSYSLRRQASKLKGIENSIRDETMPLWSYTILHKNARLSKTDKELIINWAVKTLDSISSKK